MPNKPLLPKLPLLPQSEMEREREVAKKILDACKDKPKKVILNSADIYGNAPKNLPIGTVHPNKLTEEHIYDALYKPANIVDLSRRLRIKPDAVRPLLRRFPDAWSYTGLGKTGSPFMFYRNDQAPMLSQPGHVDPTPRRSSGPKCRKARSSAR